MGFFAEVLEIVEEADQARAEGKSQRQVPIGEAINTVAGCAPRCQPIAHWQWEQIAPVAVHARRELEAEAEVDDLCKWGPSESERHDTLTRLDRTTTATSQRHLGVLRPGCEAKPEKLNRIPSVTMAAATLCLRVGGPPVVVFESLGLEEGAMDAWEVQRRLDRLAAEQGSHWDDSDSFLRETLGDALMARIALGHGAPIGRLMCSVVRRFPEPTEELAAAIRRVHEPRRSKSSSATP